MTAYFYYILQLVNNHMTVAQVAMNIRQQWHAENRSGAEHTSDSASMSSAQTRDLDLAARIKRERCILGFARYGFSLVYMGFTIHFLATSHLFRGDFDSYFYDIPFHSIVSYCVFYIVISFILAIKFHVCLKQALRELRRDFEPQHCYQEPLIAQGCLVRNLSGSFTVPSEEDEIQPGAFDRASSAQEGKIAPGRFEIVSTAGSKSIDVDAVDNTQLRALPLIDYYGTRPLTQYKKLNTQKTQSQSRLPSLLKSVLSTGYSFAEDV
eukprot:g23679.t1